MARMFGMDPDDVEGEKRLSWYNLNYDCPSRSYFRLQYCRLHDTRCIIW